MVEDPAWLGAQIRALTAQQERTRAAPWAVDDALATFVAARIKGIVGSEIPIARIGGKWKASQNRPPVDREDVAVGLEEEGGEAALAMAELVRERSQPSIGRSVASPSR